MARLLELDDSPDDNGDYKLASIFKTQYANQDSSCDLSLMCRDGDVIKCHKSVMAAFSPYFRKIIKTMCQDGIYPRLVIPFPTETSEHMKHVLDLIYFKEINVPNLSLEKVKSLLATFGIDIKNRAAHVLPVSTPQSTLRRNILTAIRPSAVAAAAPSWAGFRPRRLDIDDSGLGDELRTPPGPMVLFNNVLGNRNTTPTTQSAELQTSSRVARKGRPRESAASSGPDGHQEGSAPDDSSVVTIPDERHCYQCCKTFCSKYSLRRHMFTLHTDSFPMSCPFCEAELKNLKDMKSHASKQHGLHEPGSRRKRRKN